MLEKVIFGDNQFFGINHMSEEKAEALAVRFANLDAIIEVLDIAYDSGIRAFMLNTNERTQAICDHLRQNSRRYPDLVLYPSLPYAHKYANLVAEKGIFGAINEVLLGHSSAAQVISMIGKGSRVLLERDLVQTMQLLVDLELKPFAGLNVKVVFLQNIVTDLLLGMGMKELFVSFADYLGRRYQAEAGFNTMNMPALVPFLHDCGLPDPIVCSSINKAGYFMNPDLASYQRALGEGGFRPVAMSVLASGAVPPQEAIEFVCQDLGVKSVVFGASSRRNIVETKGLIESYCR